MKDLSQKIREQLDFFSREFDAGRIESLVNGFFTEDCIVTGADVPLMIGRAAAIGGFTQLRQVQAAVRFELIELRPGHGDMHMALVQSLGIDEDGNEEPVKSLVTFREVGESLLCEVDFFTPGSYEQPL